VPLPRRSAVVDPLPSDSWESIRLCRPASSRAIRRRGEDRLLDSAESRKSNDKLFLLPTDFLQIKSTSKFGTQALPASFRDTEDGTSQTLLFGERYHYDPVFDARLHDTGKFSRYPLHKWGAWGWTGGGNGTTHLFASSRVAINYTTPATASGYSHVNRRMSAFGSGHPGGANFVMADGSARFMAKGSTNWFIRSMLKPRGRLSVGIE